MLRRVMILSPGQKSHSQIKLCGWLSFLSHPLPIAPIAVSRS